MVNFIFPSSMQIIGHQINEIKLSVSIAYMSYIYFFLPDDIFELNSRTYRPPVVVVVDVVAVAAAAVIVVVAFVVVVVVIVVVVVFGAPNYV